ncbi:MAG: pyridoxamine 5'-phosphate oxidase family protein [bacterium]
MKGLSRGSAWSAERVEEFLESYRAPLRLAVTTGSGHPMICSLWFRSRDGRLLCATKDDAKIVEWLRADPRCAFELAPNEPPYFGVRGRGRASIFSEGAADLLGELIDRYLGSRESELAGWLLSNAENEVTIAIEPEWLTSWDYSARMGGEQAC